MSVDLFKSVDDTSLHMPLSMLSVTNTPVESGEGSIFMIPPSKRSQSSIIFGRVQPRKYAVTDSGSNSEPSQFSPYAWLTHHMMRKMGYNLQRGNGLNLGRGRHGLLWTFVPKGKPANYYDKTRRGLRYVSPPSPLPTKEDKSFPSYSSTSSEWELDVSVGVLFKDLFVNMTLNRSIEAWRGYWNIWGWAMGSSTQSPVGKVIWTTWTAHWG